MHGHFRSQGKGGGLWRSRHSIFVVRNPMLHANFMAVGFIQRSYCQWKFFIAGIGFRTTFAFVTWWPSHTNLTRNSWRYTGRPTLRLAGKSYHITGHEYVHLVKHGHFRSRDKGGSHTIRSTIVRNPMLHADFMAMLFGTGFVADQNYTLQEYEFSSCLGCCDLDLDPMTFIYELDLYSLKIYRMCKNLLCPHFRKLQVTNACI